MSTPANDVEAGLPIASSVAASNDDVLLSAQLLADNDHDDSYQQQPPPKHKYDDDTGRYHLTSTTAAPQQQHYWGRFNDTPAEIITSHMDDNNNEPAVYARPDDRHVRLTFLRNVYSILSAQMILTVLVCTVMTLSDPIRAFVLGPGLVLYYINTAAVLILICAMHVYKRQYPVNYYILTAFTFCMAYMVGTVTAIYQEQGLGGLIVEAVVITATVFVLLTVFTLQSKWDFSFLGAGLGVCLWIMILWSLFGLIFGFVTGSVFALLGAVLFSLFIIYDTYMIAERLDPEDYIVAAIELYLDIVNLFLYILQLLGQANRR